MRTPRHWYHGFLRPSPHVSRAEAVKMIWQAPNDYEIIINEPRRSNPQSAKMHAMLGDMVKQGVKWAGGDMDVEDWKDLMSATLARNPRAVPGLEGGVVILGLHTSTMSVAQIAQMIEHIYAFGSQQNPPVIWSETFEPTGRPK